MRQYIRQISRHTGQTDIPRFEPGHVNHIVSL